MAVAARTARGARPPRSLLWADERDPRVVEPRGRPTRGSPSAAAGGPFPAPGARRPGAVPGRPTLFDPAARRSARPRSLQCATARAARGSRRAACRRRLLTAPDDTSSATVPIAGSVHRPICAPSPRSSGAARDLPHARPCPTSGRAIPDRARSPTRQHRPWSTPCGNRGYPGGVVEGRAQLSSIPTVTTQLSPARPRLPQRPNDPGWAATMVLASALVDRQKSAARSATASSPAREL